MWPKERGQLGATASIRARGKTHRSEGLRASPCLEKVELRAVLEFLSYAATGPRFRSFQKMFPIHPRVFPSSSSSSFSFAFSRSVHTNVGPLTPTPPPPPRHQRRADFEHQAALKQLKSCTNATGSVRGAAPCIPPSCSNHLQLVARHGKRHSARFRGAGYSLVWVRLFYHFLVSPQVMDLVILSPRILRLCRNPPLRLCAWSVGCLGSPSTALFLPLLHPGSAGLSKRSRPGDFNAPSPLVAKVKPQQTLW